MKNTKEEYINEKTLEHIEDMRDEDLSGYSYTDHFKSGLMAGIVYADSQNNSLQISRQKWQDKTIQYRNWWLEKIDQIKSMEGRIEELKGKVAIEALSRIALKSQLKAANESVKSMEEQLMYANKLVEEERKDHVNGLIAADARLEVSMDKIKSMENYISDVDEQVKELREELKQAKDAATNNYLLAKDLRQKLKFEHDENAKLTIILSADNSDKLDLQSQLESLQKEILSDTLLIKKMGLQIGEHQSQLTTSEAKLKEYEKTIVMCKERLFHLVDPSDRFAHEAIDKVETLLTK